jgi:hypothetical protein
LPALSKHWNQLLYPRVIDVCRQPFESHHDFFLCLIIVVELLTSEMFLLVKKQVEITWRKVRTVRRMAKYIPLEYFQKCSSDMRRMRPRVVVEQAHAT